MATPKVPVGIDLGTSNSVLIMIPSGGVPQPVKSPEGDVLHQSIVFYPRISSEQVLFGSAARAQMPNTNCIQFPKRAIGVTTAALQRKGLSDAFNAKISSKGKEEVHFEIEVDGNKTAKPVVEVMMDLLKHYVTLIKNEVNAPVGFVISRPQYWGEPQCAAFMKIVKEVLDADELVDVICEPIAAVFAYEATRQSTKTQYFVVDVGGGTTDTCMMQEKGKANYVVYCTGGDNFIGGTDADRYLLDALLEELRAQPGFQEQVWMEQMTELNGAMKELKHRMSVAKTASHTVYGCTPTGYKFQLDEEKKNKILQPYYDGIKKAITETFMKKAKRDAKKAGLFQKTVEVVYMVGGAMRDPNIHTKLLPEIFSKAEILGKQGTPGAWNTDEVVGHGNAFWCASKMKAVTKIGLPKNAVVTNAISKSLGIEGVLHKDGKQQGAFCVVVPANTALPACEESPGFSTSEDNQDKARINVFQGEGTLVKDDDMDYLGSFDVDIGMPNKKDGPMISVQMRVDENNILTVQAGEDGRMEKKVFDKEIH